MRTLFSLIALPITFAIACSDSPASGVSSGTGGGVAPQGGSGNAGSSNTATGGTAGSATGGTTSMASGGAPTSGGAATSSGGAAGGSTASNGGSSTSRGGSAAGGQTGSAGAPNSSGGSAGGASTSSGGGGQGGASGAPSGGKGGETSGGSGGGGGNPGGCTRELLKGAVDAYFKALAAHDPSTLALAAGVKFTENGKSMKLGEEGLWKTAGALKYAHRALDTESCTAATQAVVPEGTMDIPFALRLKLQNQKITEIETIAVRPGDYKVSGSNFASNTNAIIASGDSVKWEQSVAADQRATRAEITGWMDKYFRAFPRGVCNTTSSCKRIENGGGDFSCSAGASCASGQPSGQPALNPRLILADVETGVGVGFTIFQGNTDMHMFKMYGDQVHGVSAILGAASSSGWE